VLYEFIFYATKFSYNQSLISLHLWNSKHVKREPEILAMLSSICVSRCLSLQNHSEDWYVALIHNYALERWFRVSFYSIGLLVVLKEVNMFCLFIRYTWGLEPHYEAGWDVYFLRIECWASCLHDQRVPYLHVIWWVATFIPVLQRFLAISSFEQNNFWGWNGLSHDPISEIFECHANCFWCMQIHARGQG